MYSLGKARCLLTVLLILVAAVPSSASAWKTAEVPNPYGSGLDLYAYVNGDDASLALVCRINSSASRGFLSLNVRVGRAGEYVDYRDPRATISVQFGDEKMETDLAGVYRDLGDVKEAFAWGPTMQNRVARRFLTVDEDSRVKLRVVPKNGLFVLRSVSFSLSGAREAVAAMGRCLGVEADEHLPE